MKAVAFGNFTKGLRAAKLAIAAMNITLLANPFGIFIAGLAACIAPLVLFKKQLADATAEGRRLAAEAEVKLAAALKTLQE